MQTGQTSVRVVDPGRLTGKEKRRLLAGLEKFANLGDELEDYLSFARHLAEFWPVRIHTELRQEVINWEPSCHKLVLWYRDCLRGLWRLDPDFMRSEALALLMGVSHRLLDISALDLELLKSRPGGRLSRMLRGWEVWPEVLKEIFEHDPDAFLLGAGLYPSWQTGDFVYRPQNDFQRAVYLLFRERWRAKICLQCGSHFVARRPPQLYCSAKCFREAKRIRDLTWRRRDRSKIRKVRAANARKKGGK